MDQIIECIPNISEGRDSKIIDSVVNEVNTVRGVKLLHTDSNSSANRTVLTFAGIPDKVVDAAYNMIAKAAELIDMRNHTGVHPRIGAVDVCPLVPLKNVTMEDTVLLSEKLAVKVGEKLGIPVYCYGYSASSEERKNLANIRSVEYEILKKKMK
jgi:glutamate formiminotransferase/formiminotetrahydrofolate cyclodeaminase